MSNPNNPGIPDDNWQWYPEGRGHIGDEEAVSPEEHAYPEASRTVETLSDYSKIAECLLGVVAHIKTGVLEPEITAAVHKVTGFTEEAVGEVFRSLVENGLVTSEAEGVALTEWSQTLLQDADEPRSD